MDFADVDRCRQKSRRSGMIFAAGIVKDANVFEIIRHPWFMSAFIAGAFAQSIKFVP